MKVLVTGGSGYLGIHVRRFFDADDFSRRAGFDILDPYDASRVADYDTVIHLAAHLDKSHAAAAESFRTNAEGTANLLAHMREGATFIYASTKDVYGAHADAYAEVPESCATDYCGQSPLEWSKLMGERYVEYYAAARGLRACVFRLSAVYARPSEGNESNFVTHYVEAVKRGWPLSLPAGGRPLRDILHVEDFARACHAFMDSGLARGTYNLGGGREQATTLRGIAETVGRLIQLEPVFEETTRPPAPVPFNYVSDLSRVRAELGWQPLIGVEDGLKSLL
ncbi:MAG: CDP-paratose 2-epimerase [Pyrinomonadaceae bacterium]|jgi:nucleoside-diphosphate-sugar epimerase|nr:CDP-paratose 2-epimerase [Pyrinomonadaceae bacterium]